jgi:hypothetical protein
VSFVELFCGTVLFGGVSWASYVISAKVL